MIFSVRSLALAVLVSFSGVAWGLMINGVDVGDIDQLNAETSDLGCPKGSSEAAELCWINSVLDPDTIYGVKEETVSYGYVDGNPSLIGFMLESPTSYFMIKNSTWWGLFSNNSNFDWAVIDTGDLDAGFNLPDGKTMTISHVATIGETVQVPEPGVLSLLGLGLVAMGLRRRKIEKS